MLGDCFLVVLAFELLIEKLVEQFTWGVHLCYRQELYTNIQVTFHSAQVITYTIQ